jgi:hypothetical protein
MKRRASVLALALLTLGVVGAAEREQTAIHKQIEAIKDSDTSAWRKIPWTSSLLAARRAAAQEKHPIFLFTHDGNIETGRC